MKKFRIILMWIEKYVILLKEKSGGDRKKFTSQSYVQNLSDYSQCFTTAEAKQGCSIW